MMQCKDIPDVPVLDFIARYVGNVTNFSRRCTWFEGYDNSVQNGMPPGVPVKLARAKMAQLIKRKLVAGCACGCRGDFEVTERGRAMLLCAA